MDEEENVRIFDLVVKEHMLPATLDKLVPLSFIGAAAVKFYQAKVKLMDQLGMSENQRKATLADGQDAGEMLLNIEARIGELLPSESEAKKTARPQGERASAEWRDMGMKVKQAVHARAIHRNPAAVAAIIKEARDNEDIPTKTAVLHKIKSDKAQEQLNAFREQHSKEKSPVLGEYLERAIEHLIQVNSVIKQFFDYPDQVDAKRMKELVRQVAIMVDIISKKTGRESWKQLA